MDNDWLDKVEASQDALSHVREHMEKIEQLRMQVAIAQEALAKAEAAYKTEQTAACRYMVENGLASVEGPDGTTYSVVTKVSCSVAKEYRRKVCEWLENQGAGSMVTHKIETMPEALPLLQENHVTYADIKDVNTATLKAWLSSQLGLKGEAPKMSMADIPQGCSFFSWDELQVRSK